MGNNKKTNTKQLSIEKKSRNIKNIHDVKKVPRNTNQIGSTDKEIICWHLSYLDINGPWGKNAIAEDHFELFDKIKSFESMKWNEIFTANKKNNHPIKIQNLSKKAIDRLRQIEMNDIEQVYSVHINGRKRLFGIRDRHIYRILWYDPKHEVCISKKKHT